MFNMEKRYRNKIIIIIIIIINFYPSDTYLPVDVNQLLIQRHGCL